MQTEVFDGRYRVERKLEKVSVGVVYLVEDLKHASEKQTVRHWRALKCISAIGLDASDTQAMLKEIKILSNLKHPNILSFFKCFVERNNFCFLMEYCEGGDLGEFLRGIRNRGEHLTEKQIGRWMVQLVLAASFMNEHKVLHGNIKTSNIFIKDGQLKIGGFTISRLLIRTHDTANAFVDTPYYMSPEVLKNEGYSNKSDIWSLGIVLYEMCTQKHAYTGTNLIRVLWQVLNSPCPTLPTNYSKELQSVLVAMLTKDVERRPSALELLQHPFIQHHLFNMFRDTVIKRADSSTSVISAKLEELNAIWKFPDSVLGNILQSERMSPMKSEIQEATECSPEEQTTTPEVDTSTLTPRERIRLGKYSEEDVEIAKLRTLAEDCTRLHTANMNHKQGDSQYGRTESLSSHLRPNLQPPEEKILQDLRSIAPVKNPRTDEQTAIEEDADDLFWPYESSIHNNSFIESPTECKEALSAAERRNQEASCPSIDVPPSHTEETRKPGVLPTYWKLYSDVTCSDTMVTTAERSWLDRALPVENSHQESPLFVCRYLAAEHHVDEDNQSNVDTIYNLEHGAITFCESTLDDAASEAPYYSSYAQSIVTMIPEIVVASNHFSHLNELESDFEDTGDDAESEQEREVEEFDVDAATPNKDDDLGFEDTMLQVLNCMRSLLQQDSGSSTTLPRTVDSFAITPHAKCTKVQRLRQHCMDKLGSKVFNNTYSYLYRRRVTEQNNAGEVTILNELRQLCPNVATGFLMDQLVFLEYKEPGNGCKPQEQLPLIKSLTVDHILGRN
ncbi:hypothetical protein EG68_02938 [Paragonimus skrjabini miyazakii]|uniref:non-specific serine/threonine protein kinase n=1 Tax=Paragonimus skrjabini miyazakii TaxID=59628 RepID=A0A8S9Z372_9TREM|nr:hypothetical protein EG68_02938 [Paragonimus skrjabini miyazakii]